MLHPHIWPISAEQRDGLLVIGGCATTDLAATYGTPLYLLDEATLRGTMRTYQAAFRATGLRFRVHYAAKALLNQALAQIVAQEGLGLDVVSGAELLVAQRAGLPPAHIHLHGNAKSESELQRALDWGVGAVVVDNLDELDLLAAMSLGRTQPQGILLRLAPNIAARTHAHIATGSADAKFGLPLDALDEAARRAMAAPGLRLLGLHAHIGSQLFDLGDLQATVEILCAAAAHLRDAHGVQVAELSPGGGLGVPYTAEQPAPDLTAYATTLAAALRQGCATYGLDPIPTLTVEPGRSIVARAGVALYQIVARKWRGDTTHYLHVDGGMADNIRPALYGARYTALLANRVDAVAEAAVTIAGRYCESGDLLIRDLPLPPAHPGDLLAVAVAGAYTLSMASSYNLTPRPALILVGEGRARLIQRREQEEDLLARDLPLEIEDAP